MSEKPVRSRLRRLGVGKSPSNSRISAWRLGLFPTAWLRLGDEGEDQSHHPWQRRFSRERIFAALFPSTR